MSGWLSISAILNTSRVVLDVLQRFLEVIDSLFKSSFLPCVCHSWNSKAKRRY